MAVGPRLGDEWERAPGGDVPMVTASANVRVSATMSWRHTHSSHSLGLHIGIRSCIPCRAHVVTTSRPMSLSCRCYLKSLASLFCVCARGLPPSAKMQWPLGGEEAVLSTLRLWRPRCFFCSLPPKPRVTARGPGRYTGTGRL